MPFDSKSALNHAVRFLADTALKRNAGGWIPPREEERQRKEQIRQELQQTRQAEKQQKEAARAEEKQNNTAIYKAHNLDDFLEEAKRKGINADVEDTDFEWYIHGIARDKNKTKAGDGAKFLEHLKFLADQHQTPIGLHVSPTEHHDILVDYYNKLGFDTTDYDSNGSRMMRMPSNPDITKSEGGPILSKQYPTHYMPNVGRQVMADGGMPDEMAAPQIQPQAQPQMPQRRQFSIASQAEPVSDIPTEMPKSDTSNPSTMSLATAFDNAINHHLSLSRGDRILNSKEAIKRLAPHVGMRKDNTLVPLLGKNEKLLKTETGYKGEEPVTWHDGRGIEEAGLSLAPSFEVNNFNTCPNSASCKDECLGKTSGNYFKLGGGKDLSKFEGPRLNSLNKTLAMVNEPEAFAVRLHDEIAAKKREAEMNGNILAVRLNVLSDINPRVHQSIIKAFPDVAFYDYTKMAYKPVADNHHYTYSSTGVSQPDVENPNSNWKRMRRMLDTGENVAMAFTDKEHLPETVFDEESGKRYRVVNGDKHDFRPLDRVEDGEDGVIIGLKSKKGFGSEADAHKESGGFFVKYDPGRLKTAKGTYEREPSQEIGPSGKPKLGTTKITNTEVRIMPQKKQQVPMTNDGLREGEI